MRKILTLSALALAAASWAGDGILGTKASPVTGAVTADSGVGAMPFLQMMLALGVVLLLLKFVLPKLANKLNKKIVTKDGSGIQIEESAAFAGGSLYIVKARSKTLLLSVSSTGVTCLSDLTTTQQPAPDLPTFRELVEKEQSGPLQPFAVIEADIPNLKAAPKPTPSKAKRVLDIDDIGSNKREPVSPGSQADAAAILERLNRLSG